MSVLRDDVEPIVRDVEAGETVTLTRDGRPVALVTPCVDPEGPQTWVPAARAVGALAHLGLPADVAARWRGTVDENVVTEAEDPFTRWEELQARLTEK
ncbi:hypothetical protein CLV37_10778 [Kineococcus rhizosphaerae]|uniref:Prevent-host-death family protein n=1 Tax=Kineococcus rhizosphaerae TaxID=559628 RepID=A0A2T0R2F4_9ACTN|nr:hypothetical protein CLV37_10778 [Kineococcus rhizosphaerae]